MPHAWAGFGQLKRIPKKYQMVLILEAFFATATSKERRQGNRLDVMRFAVEQCDVVKSMAGGQREQGNLPPGFGGCEVKSNPIIRMTMISIPFETGGGRINLIKAYHCNLSGRPGQGPTTKLGWWFPVGSKRRSKPFNLEKK